MLNVFLSCTLILHSAFAGTHGALSFSDSAQLINYTYQNSKTFKDFIQSAPLPNELRTEFVKLATTKNFYNLKSPEMKLTVNADSARFVIAGHELKIKKADHSVWVNHQRLKSEKIKNFENFYEQFEGLLKDSNKKVFNPFYPLWINQAHAMGPLVVGLISVTALFMAFLATLDWISSGGVIKFIKDKSGLFNPADSLVEKELLQIKCEKQIVAGQEKFLPSEVKVTIKCKDKTDCDTKHIKFSYKEGQLTSIKDAPCLIRREANGVFRTQPLTDGSQECPMNEFSEKQLDKNIYSIRTLEFQCEKYPETEVFRTVFPISGVSKSRENFENDKVRVSKKIIQKTEPQKTPAGR